MSDAAPWTDDELRAVETAVLAVPGVTELYRGRPTVGSAVAAVRRLGASEGGLRVVPDGDVLRVVIGTDGASPAPAVARAVHDAVLTVLGTRTPPSRVDVRVARVG
jgi:hypothetical protein